jgi:hypothetical protein
MLTHSVVKRNDTVTTQKFLTLLDIFLDAFKGKGHCVMMDSGYMGDTMDQIGREEWNGRDNQNESHGSSCGGGGTKVKVGTYKSIFWQHHMLNLCYLVWLDNNKVKT